jgi:predicted 3-demethylubiquinone-9 3-methyltransferase (glyoxalase superfamily)
MLTIFAIFITLLTFSCQAPNEEASQQFTTALPAVSAPEKQEYTCADIDSQWGSSWPIVIAALNDLINRGQTCGDQPLLSK